MTRLPNVLELLSYVFFCSGCIVGPFFEFADYINYIERKGRYENIPLTFVPSLIRFVQGKCK